ncbi:MAG: hypothetical protein LBU13_01555 [Synergistaceae bacterium]|jgi:hypothetical protein|nr:hypothetical protein [Synergistaceae bacterium]
MRKITTNLSLHRGGKHIALVSAAAVCFVALCYGLSGSIAAPGFGARESYASAGQEAADGAAVPGRARGYAKEQEKLYRGFTYVIRSGKVHILDYAGNDMANSQDVVVVPGTIEKKPVVSAEILGAGGKSIDFSKCAKLQSLYAEGLFFDTVNLSKNKELKSLQLHESGRTTALDLRGAKKLENILLYVEDLSSLDVSKCAKLKKILLFYTKMSTLDIRGCKALKELEIGGNTGCTITMKNNKALTSLRYY